MLCCVILLTMLMWIRGLMFMWRQPLLLLKDVASAILQDLVCSTWFGFMDELTAATETIQYIKFRFCCSFPHFFDSALNP